MLHFAKPPRPSEHWRAFVADAAIRLAHEVGWPAELVRIDNERLEIDCGGKRLVATDFGRPADLSPTADPADGAFHAPSPAEIAMAAFAEAFGCEGGAATVIAPVGRYASPVELGMIDAVAVPPGGLRGPTMDMITVGHSRCWVVLARVPVSRPWTLAEVAHSLQQSPSLRMPPADFQFTDTATLCEAMVDEGWAGGLFPLPVVMASGVAGNTITGWLAVTEASTIIALAGEIGARIAVDGTAAQRLAHLVAAWKTVGHRR